MISEAEARKAYPSNTPVIRKGDRQWKSDNRIAGREGESYGMNPLSKMEQKLAQHRSHAIVPEQDPNTLPLLARTVTGDGRDAYHWEVVPAERLHRTSARGKGFALHEGQVWRLRYTEKNGAR